MHVKRLSEGNACGPINTFCQTLFTVVTTYDTIRHSLTHTVSSIVSSQQQLFYLLAKGIILSPWRVGSFSIYYLPCRPSFQPMPHILRCRIHEQRSFFVLPNAATPPPTARIDIDCCCADPSVCGATHRPHPPRKAASRLTSANAKVPIAKM